MPTFSGKHQYVDPDGSIAQAGPCQVTFDDQTLTVVGGASPLAFDLGDIDVVSPGGYELALTLYTGRRLVLTQFGKAFQNLSHDLLEAERGRLVRCLLVGDLPEIARYEAFAELKGAGQPIGGPAEIRLYQSNVAILPLGATGFQWRLADIDKVSFDEASYAVVLESGSERLLITRLARRTGEFRERLAQTVAAVAEKSVSALHTIFPFLDPDQLGRIATLMTEGRVARLDALGGVHPQIPRALVEKAVDAKLKPYFDELSRRAAPGGIHAGFKLIRKEAETPPADEQADASGADTSDAPPHPDEAESSANGAGAEEVTAAAGADGEHEGQEEEVLYWFFFPLKKAGGASVDRVAWEATSKSGRATYVFRLAEGESGRGAATSSSAGPMESAIRRLNSAMGALNFRREPIYLPDERLTGEIKYRHYAIATRRLPDLGFLRRCVVGRAIHTSQAAWQKQLEGLLA